MLLEKFEIIALNSLITIKMKDFKGGLDPTTV